MPPDAGEIRIRGHFCALKPNLERRGCLVQALQDQAPQPGTEQKNTALEQAESTAVNTDPAQHTAVEQAVIDEYQAAVDDNLRVIVEGYKANPNRAFARHTISQVTERQAKDAENLLGGNYTGFSNAINSNGIKHILKEHGENGVVDHSMADVNDLARIERYQKDR